MLRSADSGDAGEAKGIVADDSETGDAVATEGRPTVADTTECIRLTLHSSIVSFKKRRNTQTNKRNEISSTLNLWIV